MQKLFHLTSFPTEGQRFSQVNTVLYSGVEISSDNVDPLASTPPASAMPAGGNFSSLSSGLSNASTDVDGELNVLELVTGHDLPP